MVDVGAGAGFPGIVTKIFKPELELTLMEPTGKRVEFLKYACGQLGLTGVEFAKERAEEAARKAWREQFDLASARAERKPLDRKRKHPPRHRRERQQYTFLMNAIFENCDKLL